MVDRVKDSTTAWAYDHLGRMTSQRTTKNTDGSVLESYLYRHDGNSNRLETSDSTGAPPKSYAYDEANQLCWVYSGSSSNGCSSPPAGATTYTYDKNGNTLSSSDGYRFTYNAQNQTTSLGAPGRTAWPAKYRDVGGEMVPPGRRDPEARW